MGSGHSRRRVLKRDGFRRSGDGEIRVFWSRRTIEAHLIKLQIDISKLVQDSKLKGDRDSAATLVVDDVRSVGSGGDILAARRTICQRIGDDEVCFARCGDVKALYREGSLFSIDLNRPVVFSGQPSFNALALLKVRTDSIWIMLHTYPRGSTASLRCKGIEIESFETPVVPVAQLGPIKASPLGLGALIVGVFWTWIAKIGSPPL